MLESVFATRNRGYSLVELMVSVLLCVFIVAVSFTFMLSSSKAFLAHRSEALVQENARFAIAFLSDVIRSAGSAQLDRNTPLDSPVSVTKLCSFSAMRSNRASDSGPCNVDRLSIWGDRIALQSVSAGSFQACGGGAEQGGLDHSVIVLWVADIDADGISSLYCQMYSHNVNKFTGSAVPLVDGMENMQFQLGLDLNFDGIVDVYETQTKRLSQFPEAHVKAVRFSLLVSAGTRIHEDQNTDIRMLRSYRLLDGQTRSFHDGHYRKLMLSTVAVLGGP